MTVHVVTDDASLAAKIRAAVDGDEIRLRPGTYSLLKVWTAYDPKWSTTPITITSDDPTNRAVVQSLEFAGAVGIKLTGLVFKSNLASGAPNHTKPFYVGSYNAQQSENIEFLNCEFIGQNATAAADPTEIGYGTAYGFFALGAKGLVVRDNSFRTFMRGAVFTQCQDLLVQGNSFRDMSSDAMDFVQSQRVRIAYNDIREFRIHPDSPAHPDCIQFWTSGTNVPSTDIEIDHNVIFNFGEFSQSIFIRNEVVDQGLAGLEMYYKNINIHNNIIVNAHTHGITVGETDGLKITDNVMMNNANLLPNGLVWVPRIHVSTKNLNVLIDRNIQPIMPLEEIPSPLPAGWTVGRTLILQREDATKLTYFGAVLNDPFNPIFKPENFYVKAGHAEASYGFGPDFGTGSPTPNPTPTPTPTPTPEPVKVAVVPAAALIEWIRSNRRKGAVNADALLAYIAANTVMK